MKVKARISVFIVAALALIAWAASNTGLQALPLDEPIAEGKVESDPDNGFLTGPSKGSPVTIATAYLTGNEAALGLVQTDLGETAVSQSYTAPSDFTQVEFTQQFDGIDVYNGTILVNVAGDGSIINMHNQFVPDLANQINTSSPRLTAEEAVNSAAKTLGLTPVGLTVEQNAKGSAQETLFNDGAISRRPIPAQLIYQPTDKGVRLAWAVDIYMIDEDNWWNMRVDAVTGRVLDQFNYVIQEDFIEQVYLARGVDARAEAQEAVSSTFSPTSNAISANTYTVYAWPVESPNHSTPPNPADGRSVISNPSGDASANAAPFGWHSDNTTSWTNTQGNNVEAQKNGTFSECGASLDCNTPLDLTVAPTAASNVTAATDNLFYWNNLIHDVWYNYGFDEVSRNFQQNNNGQGGAGGDRVIANVQASGNCNANFGTPPDGGQPTMNMFNCDNATPARDGDFDNGVIAHEYTHGISTRLTGGASVSCLNSSEQMGEGWSDWYSLMMTIEAGDAGADARSMGTWLLGTGANGPGIRTQRYSTDMAVNTHTYDDIKTAVIPHGVGEVWATMIWDMNWNLIDKGSQSGLDLDIYNGTGGNNLAMQLVTDGLKLQPCNPGFVDGRDAILLADQNLTGGANQCAIWESFARRGLGVSATQGSSGSTTDGAEAFDIPLSCNFVNPQPVSQDVCEGTDALYAVGVNQAFSAPVLMSVAGEPVGSTVNFSSNPVTAPLPQTITMTIGNLGGATVGNYTITITGTDSTPVSESATVDLNVFPNTLSATTLVAPADGALNVQNNPVVTWTAVSGAGSYIIEVDDDPSFGSIDYTGVESGISHQISGLSGATLYYWRVTSSNVCGAGTQSAVWSFTTRTIPPILLVDDDDNNPDVRSFYTDALDAVGAQYDVWDTGNSDDEPSAAELSPYDTVIWFTGDEFDNITGPGADGESALATWLDNGSCLFISAQDYYYARGQTAFMTNYLGLASAVSDNGDYASVTGQGFVFNGYGPYTLDYGPVGIDYSDTFVATASAEIAFQGNNGNDAAINKDNGVYRTTFWGYSYEAIATAAARQEAMSAVLNWCGSDTTSGTLNGTVTDIESGLAISGADISTGGSFATTDANGEYSMVVAAGTVDVTVSATNYYSETITAVTIITDTTTTVDAALTWAMPRIDVFPADVEAVLLTGQTAVNSFTIVNRGPVSTTFTLLEIPGGFTPAFTAVSSNIDTIGNPAVSSETVDTDIVSTSGQPSAIALTSTPFVAAAMPIYDNGPLITHPGGGAGGADASILQENLGMNNYGLGHQLSVGNRIADDFVVDSAWTIDTITFYAYQTNSGLPSTMTGVYLQIWDGPPDDPSSTVIFGDTTTNRLTNTAFSGIYRSSNTDITNAARPIMANTVAVGISLPAGTYWLDWMTDGTAASGPWAPPITELGSTTTGNALQFLGSWGEVVDVGTQGFPFTIEGTVGDIPWFSANPITGTIPANSSITIDGTFNSMTYTLGTYTGTLRLQTADSANGNIFVPVTMNVVDTFNTYLPAIMSPTYPDLVVDAVNMTADSLEVIITNNGTAATAAGFWVDLYINPAIPPTGVNQTWETNGGEGVVWGIDTALAAGDSLTLTLTSPYYIASESNFSGTMAAGATVYAQVDAVGDVTYGAIFELDETNNLMGPLTAPVAVTPPIALLNVIASEELMALRR